MLQLQQVRSNGQDLKQANDENAFQVPRLLAHIIYLLVRRPLPLVTKSRPHRSNATRFAIGKSFLEKSIPQPVFSVLPTYFPTEYLKRIACILKIIPINVC